MLTVDFARFPVRPGDRVLDLGCGGGRHAFEIARRGGRALALDTDLAELRSVSAMIWAMNDASEIRSPGSAAVTAGDATRLPFGDAVFDKVIAAEVLEHIPADHAALAEIARVLRPGGLAAVTVPAWLPERICWALSDEYHTVPGGHIRIFTRPELEAKLAQAGLQVSGHHHAHALHSPYWWLKCAVGVHNDGHPLARACPKLLVWQIMKNPPVLRLADRLLNPVLGKSIIIYARKPAPAAAPAAAAPAAAAGAAAPAGGPAEPEQAHAGA